MQVAVPFVADPLPPYILPNQRMLCVKRAMGAPLLYSIKTGGFIQSSLPLNYERMVAQIY